MDSITQGTLLVLFGNIIQFLGLVLGALLGAFLGLAPVFQVYIALMVIDTLASILIDIGPGGAGISSVKVWNGIRGKSMSVLVILASAIMSVYVGIPAGQWVAGAFAFKEAVSIAESAAKLGMLPEPYNQILALFRSKADPVRPEPTPPPAVILVDPPKDPPK